MSFARTNGVAPKKKQKRRAASGCVVIDEEGTLAQPMNWQIPNTTDSWRTSPEDYSDDEELMQLWLKENRGKGAKGGKGANDGNTVRENNWGQSGKGDTGGKGRGRGETRHSVFQDRGMGGKDGLQIRNAGKGASTPAPEETKHRRQAHTPEYKDPFHCVYLLNCPTGLSLKHVRKHYIDLGFSNSQLTEVSWVTGRDGNQDFIGTLWESPGVAMRAWASPPPKCGGASPVANYGGHKGVNVRHIHEKLTAMKERRRKVKGHSKLWAAGKSINPKTWDPETLLQSPVIKDFQHAILAKEVPADKVSEFRTEHSVEVDSDAPPPILSFDGVDFGADVIGGLKAVYKQPTPIQSQAWPILLSGRDCLGIAETGCGKTLAFMLPAILHMNVQRRPYAEEGPTTLVLVPTRELSLQINEHFAPLALHAGLRSAILYGQGSYIEQATNFLRGVDAVVATPGRAIDLVEAELISFDRVTYLVLDEADRMVSMGFAEQTKALVAQTRPDRQTALFCATWEPGIHWLAEFMKDPITLAINKADHKVANKNVEQHIVICHDIEEKKRELKRILYSLPPTTESTRTLIFAQEKQVVQALYEVLCTEFDKMATLHGDMKQDERIAALRKLKKEPHAVMVATEVASRGLDIKGLVCVVNFDMPHSIDTYINNIGRTGRAGHKGLAYSLFEPSRDSAIVPALARCMEESGQDPPLELYKYYHKKAPKPKPRKQRKEDDEENVQEDQEEGFTDAWYETFEEAEEAEEAEDDDNDVQADADASKTEKIKESKHSQAPGSTTDVDIDVKAPKKRKLKKRKSEEVPGSTADVDNAEAPKKKKAKKRKSEEVPGSTADVDNAEAPKKKKAKKRKSEEVSTPSVS